MNKRRYIIIDNSLGVVAEEYGDTIKLSNGERFCASKSPYRYISSREYFIKKFITKIVHKLNGYITWLY